MNEEFSSVVCIALAHGAKGIMPYCFSTGKSLENDPVNGWKSCEIGMLDFAPSDPVQNGKELGINKRKKNFYNQPKWDYVKDLYGKIKVWNDFTIHSSATIGYSIAKDGANHEFIYDISSIDPNQQGQNGSCVDDGLGGYWTDCPYERYFMLKS